MKIPVDEIDYDNIFVIRDDAVKLVDAPRFQYVIIEDDSEEWTTVLTLWSVREVIQVDSRYFYLHYEKAKLHEIWEFMEQIK